MPKTRLRLHQVGTSNIGSPTYADLQAVNDLTRSAGHLNGGDITDAGGGSINISAGQGFIRATNDDASTLFSFDWAALNGQAITNNSIRYVVVNYHTTTPFLSVETSDTSDYRTIFVIGIVVRENGITLINNTPHNVGRIAGRVARRNVEVDGRSRANGLGGLIISETGTRNLSVTAGVTWYRAIRDSFTALDTNVSGSFTNAYRDGGSAFTFQTTQTQFPVNQYDDGTGTLATISNNNRVVYWVYLSGQGNIVMVYGRQNNGSLAAAQAEPTPSTLPLRLQVGSVLLGRFIYKRTGGTTALELTETAFGTTFTSGTPTSHNNLAGIQGGNTTEQYHLTYAEYLAAIAGGSTSFSVNATLDFGFPSGREGFYTTLVINNALVTNANIKGYNFIALANADHDVLDQSVEDIKLSIGNIVDGVSFEVTAYAPRGTWGQYNYKILLTI